MLGLPSTTEVLKGGRIPKEAFYSHIKLSSKLKQKFVDEVESFTIVNTIKSNTTNVSDGKKIHEIAVLKVELKNKEVPIQVLETVVKAVPRKLIFVCRFDAMESLAVSLGKIVVGDWKEHDSQQLSIKGDSLDQVWDSLVSQIVFNDYGLEDKTVEERFLRAEKIETLKREIADLDTKAKKAKQIVRKNEFFKQKQQKQAELNAFEEGK